MDFKGNVKKSFQKVKDEIEDLKALIKQQNEVLRLISEKNNVQIRLENLEDFSTSIEPETPPFYSSTGNNGVRQTDRQTDRQLDRDLVNQAESSNFAISGDLTSRQTIRQTDSQQLQQQGSIYSFKDSINKIFKSLSRQEKKAFLTIYQLEDDGAQEISYWEIAQEMKVSESCIRDHIRNLTRKKAPITKIKVNGNLRVLLGIEKDFKSLNLKQKLIDLYYSSDPDQTKLFDE